MMSVSEKCELDHLMSFKLANDGQGGNSAYCSGNSRIVAVPSATSNTSFTTLPANRMATLTQPLVGSRRPSSERSSHYSKNSSVENCSTTLGGGGAESTRVSSVFLAGCSSNTSAHANTSSGGHTVSSKINPLTGALIQDLKPPRPPQPDLSRLQNRKDVMDVRQMEQALLGLLEDFHSGKLRAFGKGCNMEQMTAIHEQQECLARLHFELGAQQELFEPLSEDAIRLTSDNMTALMDKLEQLSFSIERLHTINHATDHNF